MAGCNTTEQCYLVGVQYEKAWREMAQGPNYSTYVFPYSGHWDTSLIVQVQITVLTLISLSTDSTLDLAARISLSWRDPNLACKFKQCYDEQHLSFPVNSSLVWKPKLALAQAASADMYLNYQETAYVAPMENGSIINARITQELVTSCDSMDTTMFPYDRQKCQLTVVFDSVDIEKVRFAYLDSLNDSTAIIVAETAGSDEWEITGSSLDFTESEGRVNRAKFHVHLAFRRHGYYYGTVVMFPAVVITALLLFVFVLPCETGERIGLCSTLLLAMFVFQQMFASIIPQFQYSQTPVIFKALQSAFLLCAVLLVECILLQAVVTMAPGFAYHLERAVVCLARSCFRGFGKLLGKQSSDEQEEAGRAKSLPAIETVECFGVSSAADASDEALDGELVQLLESVSRALRFWHSEQLQRMRSKRAEQLRFRAWLRFQYTVNFLSLLAYLTYWYILGIDVYLTLQPTDLP